MARGKNLPRSASSAESENSHSRNILAHTSCNQMFISSKRVPKVSADRSPQILFRKVGETYNRPLHFEYSERVPDSFSVCPCSEIFSVTYFNDPSGKGFSGPRGRKNVKESCNKGCPTKSQSFLQLNICRA